MRGREFKEAQEWGLEELEEAEGGMSGVKAPTSVIEAV